MSTQHLHGAGHLMACTAIAIAIIAGAGHSVAATSIFEQPDQPPPAQQAPGSKEQEALVNEFADAVAIAMQREDGRYRTEGRGELSDNMRRYLKTTKPIYLDVRRVERLNVTARDCQKMELRIQIPGLKGQGGKDVDFGYYVNACADGFPPDRAPKMGAMPPPRPKPTTQGK